MATVYSLVCWGGRTGKTVTLTIASPCVITLTNHGLRDGTGLRFKANGDTLPTGLTSGVTYYTKSTASNTFNLYSDAALTSIINTSGSESGVHILQSLMVADPAVTLAVYGLSDLSRWGSSGSERIYDSLASCNSARYWVSAGVDSEVYEIGEAFEDICSASVVVGSSGVNNGSASEYLVTTRVNGVRTPAFHNGVPYSAYMLSNTSANTSATLGVVVGDVCVDGVNILHRATSVGSLKYCVSAVTATSYNVKFLNVIASAGNAGSDNLGAGFNLNVNSLLLENCIAHGFTSTTHGYAFTIGANATTNCRLVNCLATKNYIGFYHIHRTLALYNCVSVGNTRNWRKGIAHSLGQINRCFGNIGDETDTRVVTFSAGSTLMTFTALEVTPVKSMSFTLTTTGTLPTFSGGALEVNKLYYFAGAPTTTSAGVGWYPGDPGYTLLDAGTGVHTANFVLSSRSYLGVGVSVMDFASAPQNTFTNWSANDFTPVATAITVDTNFSFAGQPVTDIAGNEKPCYAGGSAEYSDAGPFEYDKGFGPRPASHTLTLFDVVVGSRIFIRDQADTATHYDDVAAASTVVVTATVYSDSRDQWRIRIRKATTAPKYLPFETLTSVSAGSSSIFVAQVPDLIA